MAKRTHGLSDLFGSPEEAPRDGVRSDDATPQESLAATAREAEARQPGHGLAGLVPDAPPETVPEPDTTPESDPPAIVPPRRDWQKPSLPEGPNDPTARTDQTPSRIGREQAAPAPGSPLPLSCVLVATEGWRRARRTAEALSLQTASRQIELVLVCTGPLPEAGELRGLGALKRVTVPEDVGDGTAVAAGIRAARGDLVALIDDYAFPAGDWAEKVIARRGENFAALGSAFTNANPRSAFSWGNMLIDNAPWREGGRAVRGNLVFHRRDLLAFGAELERLLERQHGLAERLAAEGRAVEHEGEARIAILNPSTLSATIRSQFAAGRLSAAERAQRFSFSKKAAKAIPAAFGGWSRYRKARPKLFGGTDRSIHPRIQGRAVLIGMIAEGLGQAAGYLAGPGKAAETRRLIERRRLDMLSSVDRRQFEGDRKKR